MLKKDLMKCSEIYKHHYKMIDFLLKYSLTLIKENINDNNFIEKVILDVKKILITIDRLFFGHENVWDNFFKEQSVLVNDDEYSKILKQNFEELAKLWLNK